MSKDNDVKEVRECRKCGTFKTLDKFINGNVVCTACAGYCKYVIDNQSDKKERSEK